MRGRRRRGPRSWLSSFLWALPRLSRAGNGRAVGVLSVWIAWNHILEWIWRPRAVRPGGILRYRLAHHWGRRLTLSADVENLLNHANLALPILLILGLSSGSDEKPSSSTPSTTTATTVLPTTPTTAEPATTVPTATRDTSPPTRRGRKGGGKRGD